MSWAFITSLRKNPNQSYVQLLNSIREELEGKYDQKPQLSCSHPLSKSCHCRSITYDANGFCRYGSPIRNVEIVGRELETIDTTAFV